MVEPTPEHGPGSSIGAPEAAPEGGLTEGGLKEGVLVNESNGSALGSALGPVLIEHCRGRLGEITWFRTSWQRGGAATGFSTWIDEHGEPRPVMVKLPVNATEFIWTTRIAASGETSGIRPTPRVYAAGDEVGPYHFAWLVLERLPGNPVSANLTRDGLDGMLAATARFYAHAEEHSEPSASKVKPSPDWPRLIQKAQATVSQGMVADARRWTDLLRRVERALPALIDGWTARPITCWCHGDLHPHNVMYREIPAPHSASSETADTWMPGGSSPASGTEASIDAPGASLDERAVYSSLDIAAGGADPADPAESRRTGSERGASAGGEPVLLDLALVHAGTWVEDALYVERLFWGREDRLCGIEPLEDLASFREREGIEELVDWESLADIRRILMAASVPAFLKIEGHPVYVAGALDRLEDAAVRRL